MTLLMAKDLRYRLRLWTAAKTKDIYSLLDLSYALSYVRETSRMRTSRIYLVDLKKVIEDMTFLG